MKTLVIIKKIASAIRLFTRCPNCNAGIVCDSKVLKDLPERCFTCGSCGYEYLITDSKELKKNEVLWTVKEIDHHE